MAIDRNVTAEGLGRLQICALLYRARSLDFMRAPWNLLGVWLPVLRVLRLTAPVDRTSLFSSRSCLGFTFEVCQELMRDERSFQGGAGGLPLSRQRDAMFTRVVSILLCQCCWRPCCVVQVRHLTLISERSHDPIKAYICHSTSRS